ncbi:hydroxymethylglutaryl-CoA synthase [Wenzhouxiangella sp. XN79A]|uniref:hydroxymethylglutaryl-CoA synthase family protein n=1 Tax=Wenzhouxiangella sp. XN79A TaxID=2724193 RepID=UPI00144AC493|nr:hydroxymethylglutaryl-CoA synthase [Wenzhouxiangella sp. XN79A]NKI34418.1 hydroxymethylglutaryl-CoA synthase [Wenzhouxiangella sp. XN79A]
MNSPVGIDAAAFAGPHACLDLADLAAARGVDPDKFVLGLGQRRMAIASPCEDTVTLAVDAGRRALAAFDIDPAEIGTLIVGTETGVDHSKPVAVYVHELLGLDARCRTFETKHACYGAMAGLTASMDWIAAGRARGRKALVIASDIARYGLGTPGEPTQGAGAVALVVADRPRLLTVDPATIGDYTRQVMDFWRPLYSKVAFADGHYSIQCYLDALVGARADAVGEGAALLDELAACLYHVPFVKMAKKAHQRHLEIERGAPLDRDSDADRQALAASLSSRVEPWLTLNAEIGNIYTGSLFLSLIDLLRQAAERFSGRTVSLFSYGSGCGATFCLGEITGTAAQWASALDPSEDLARRYRLNIEDYERLVRDGEQADTAESLDPTSYGLSDGLFYVGTVDHQRRYVESRAER